MSRIATSTEQSLRMMRSGVDPLTADMYYEFDGCLIIARDKVDLEIAIGLRQLTPAWSFSKLFDLVTLNSSEYAILNTSEEYIDFLVTQIILENNVKKNEY